MAELAPAERRVEHRQRVLKGASILTGINVSAINCVVRNMHEGGAELRVSVGVHIAQKFLLYVPVDGVAYKSVMRWRTGDRVGVSFVGTTPKPNWHYG